jgi:hypothetical protein
MQLSGCKYKCNHLIAQNYFLLQKLFHSEVYELLTADTNQLFCNGCKAFFFKKRFCSNAGRGQIQQSGV